MQRNIFIMKKNKIIPPPNTIFISFHDQCSPLRVWSPLIWLPSNMRYHENIIIFITKHIVSRVRWMRVTQILLPKFMHFARYEYEYGNGVTWRDFSWENTFFLHIYIYISHVSVTIYVKKKWCKSWNFFTKTSKKNQ